MTNKPPLRPFDTFSAHQGSHLDDDDLNNDDDLYDDDEDNDDDEYNDDDEDNDDGGGRDDDDLLPSRPFVLRCTYSNLKLKNFLHVVIITILLTLLRTKFAMHHKRRYCMQSITYNMHYE